MRVLEPGKFAVSNGCEAFLELLKSTMKTDCVRSGKLVKDKIETVATCGGSGRFTLQCTKRKS